MRRIPKRVWIPVLALAAAAALLVYNRPAALRRPVLMSTPLIFQDGALRPRDPLPADVHLPDLEVFYATDREAAEASRLESVRFGNARDTSLHLGTAAVRFGGGEMSAAAVAEASLLARRPEAVPLEVVETRRLHRIGAASRPLDETLREQEGAGDPFVTRINERLSASDSRALYVFVPGYKVDFDYPLLVAAELWYYMGCPGAFLAYSWPSGQHRLAYLADVETAGFSTQHFRMLLRYLAANTEAERIHILCYSAGARIVSQALHELRLGACVPAAAEPGQAFRIGRVVFAAPDIDRMLFAARYRDGFQEITEGITVYTNANDKALYWALRFLGWPRLGAPGELGLTPEDFPSWAPRLRSTVLVDVSAAEEAASGNGHGYFIKSPWVSTDLLLTLKDGLPPGERGLVRMEGEAAWGFPEDYPRAVRRIAERRAR